MIADIAILIPFAGIGLGAFAVWADHTRKIAAIKAKSRAEPSAEEQVKWAGLEERVRVLERIITDEGYATAQQIEALREAPALLSTRPTTQIGQTASGAQTRPLSEKA